MSDSSRFEVFQSVIQARRSARRYLPEPIPEAVLERCFDAAIRAPSSHNLEIWRFLDVRDPGLRAAMNRLCLQQTSVREAPTMVVAVARPDLWRVGCDRMLERLERDDARPDLDATYRHWMPALLKKYRIMVPLLFADGPFHVLAPLKKALLDAAGLFRPMMRGPVGRAEQELWAVKTTALACQNFMLALTAAGYDSCPLEGFDEPAVKKLLGLPMPARVVMVVVAGRRGPDALIPQIRFERSFYVERR